MFTTCAQCTLAWPAAIVYWTAFWADDSGHRAISVQSYLSSPPLWCYGLWSTLWYWVTLASSSASLRNWHFLNAQYLRERNWTVHLAFYLFLHCRRSIFKHSTWRQWELHNQTWPQDWHLMPLSQSTRSSKWSGALWTPNTEITDACSSMNESLKVHYWD